MSPNFIDDGNQKMINRIEFLIASSFAIILSDINF